jgi:hypothetical protein
LLAVNFSNQEIGIPLFIFRLRLMIFFILHLKQMTFQILAKFIDVMLLLPLFNIVSNDTIEFMDFLNIIIHITYGYSKKAANVRFYVLNTK